MSLQLLLRTLAQVRLTSLSWRSLRSYFLANKAAITSNNELIVEGYLRGKPFNIHNLLHLTGYGNFQIERVEKVSKNRETLTPDPSKVSSLKSKADPDLFAGEQTWPTEEELKQAESVLVVEEEDYMAAWDAGDDSGSEMSEAEGVKGEKEGILMDIESNEQEVKKKVRFKELQKVEAEEIEFPDEREVPHDLSAKERFIKYRGLKNFKNSYWHPKETLPRDYSYIHQIDNSGGLSNNLFKEAEEQEKLFLKQLDNKETKKAFTINNEGQVIAPGQHCRFVLRIDEKLEAHKRLFTIVKEKTNKAPLVCFSVLELEQKLTVITANIKKASAAEHTTIKSKDELIIQCGFWREKVRPVFSENNLNSTKHKYLKFLPNGVFAAATFYGNVTFGQAPVLFFKNDEIVAVGSLRSEKEALNVDRIVLKRIILTGFPVRVKKNKAVVRFMFHSPNDVKWFKPVQLWTKMGASGEITESVGTHGLFKARFDRFVKSNDTICMSLYKRVFPKLIEEKS